MLHHGLVLATDLAGHPSVWSDYIHTLFDPGHILTELTVTALFDGLIGALLWPWLKRRNIRRHDSKFHIGAPHISEEQRAMNAQIEVIVQSRIEAYFQKHPMNMDACEVCDGEMVSCAKHWVKRGGSHKDDWTCPSCNHVWIDGKGQHASWCGPQ